jgi:hypothetical protein
MSARNQQQVCAIGLHLRHRTCRQSAAGAGTVEDDHRRPGNFPQLLRDQPRGGIGRPTGREADVNGDRLRQ